MQQQNQYRVAGLQALANYLAFNQSENTVDRFAIALKTCGVFLVSVPWSSQSGTSSCYGGWSAQIQSAGVTAHVSQQFQAICISHTRSHNKSTLEASLLQDGCVGGIHKVAVRSKQLRSNSQMFGAVPPCTVWRLRPVSNKVFCSGRRDDLGDDSWDAAELTLELCESACATCKWTELGQELFLDLEDAKLLRWQSCLAVDGHYAAVRGVPSFSHSNLLTLASQRLPARARREWWRASGGLPF